MSVFFLGSWEWIGAPNKQIFRESLPGSRDLFAPLADLFPMNPEKKKDTRSLND